MIAACAWVTPAQGQSCHGATLHTTTEAAWRASLASAFATYENPRFTGEYQGVFAGAAFSHPRFHAEVVVPYYRIVRNGLTDHGVGDVALDLRGGLIRALEDRLVMGIEAAWTFPAGDAGADLGMGHVMAMPGLFASYRGERLFVLLQVNYGRALGEGTQAHVHGGGTSPIVDPMNRSELEHAFGISYALTPQLRATLRLAGALPVAVKEGVTREVVGFGLALTLAPVDVTVETLLPLVGSPFRAKNVLGLGINW